MNGFFHRHRKFQIAITLGVVASGALAAMHYDFHAVATGLVTNLIWIWEA